MRATRRLLAIVVLAGLATLAASLPPSLAAPPAPTLVAPPDGALVSALPVIFSWNAVSGATSYNLQIDDNSDFSSLAVNLGTNGTSWSTSGLTNNKVYYWRVCAYDGSSFGPWAGRHLHLCVPPGRPQNLAPGSGQSGLSGVNTYFDWSDVSGATAYNLQVDDQGTFSSPFVDIVTANSYYAFSSATLPRDMYAYRVRAQNACGWGDWSYFFYFYVGPLPGKPTLLSPANGATVGGTNVYFDWTDTAETDSYRIFVYCSADRTCFTAVGSATASNYTFASLAPGTYYWDVYGVNQTGAGPTSDVWSLTVCNLPGTPTLLAPAIGAIVAPENIFLDWADVAGATQYQVQVDDDPAFGSPVANSPAVSQSFVSSLAPGTYYWRARAYNSCGWGAWAVARNFTVCAAPPAAAPGLLAPSQGAVVSPAGIVLDWSDIANAAGYQYQVDNDADFGSPGSIGSVAPSNVTLGLSDGVFYWRVRAYNPCGYGPWSAPRSFLACTTLSSPPALLAPAQDARLLVSGIVLDWGDVEGAATYMLQIASAPDFGSLRIEVAPSYSLYAVPVPLEPGTYYWRVRARNGCSDSDWPAARRFQVVAPAAGLYLPLLRRNAP